MDKAVKAGQAVYSKNVLSIYDWWVLGISNSHIWKCPTDLLEHEFTKHCSVNHLDVGVGTGYYLEHCLPSNIERVGLIDLNQNSLDEAAKRIQEQQPEAYIANVLEPLNISCKPFDSVSLNFLLHCVPGNMVEKLSALDHLDPLLNSGAKVFGSTLLTQGVNRSLGAKALMSLYNRKGIFCNEQDSLEALQSGLNKRFENVDIYTVGCVAIFSAVKS